MATDKLIPIIVAAALFFWTIGASRSNQPRDRDTVVHGCGENDRRSPISRLFWARSKDAFPRHTSRTQ